MEENTTFEEEFGNEKPTFPSFTLCPNDNSNSKKSIESFEDVAEAIENVKTNIERSSYEYQPYEGITYNQTLNNDWYFAPKTEDFSPYETVICLIIAPSNKHNPNRSNVVS